MTDFIPAEKGVPIRQPSTANLMIDSADGPKDPSGLIRKNAWDFQISRNSSILNGFFTRIATSEVVLEWNNPNISEDLSNNWLLVDVSGSGVPTLITLQDGFYTVEQLLKQLEVLIDVTPANMTINYNPASAGLFPCNIEFSRSMNFEDSPLAFALGLPTNVVIPETAPIYLVNVDLRPYRYIDFVSAQLTYNQDLKDSSTAVYVRDVLCRWYFDWDNAAPQVDAYGFPIEMGYTSFHIRRLYNPPKQIRWSANQPIGNLAFEVYGTTSYINSPANNKIVVQPAYDGKSNWLMTLQISEV